MPRLDRLGKACNDEGLVFIRSIDWQKALCVVAQFAGALPRLYWAPSARHFLSHNAS